MEISPFPPDAIASMSLYLQGGDVRGAQGFVSRTIVRVGRYLSHCSYKTLVNSWFLCKQDAISNKIPLKIKMDCLKSKLQIVEALSASPPTNESILNNDEDNSVVVPLTKRSKRYNPPAIHVMAFILAIPG
ncbi:uncharacterized protein TNCV_3581261 [Trichonephila clavipes]|nr:uncharacterized protein TNCV_3581261 [Trichonephila clavipes]